MLFSALLVKRSKKYFGAFLESTSQVLQKDKPKLIEELLEYYDGLCFEETAKQTVFSPWSLLKFFPLPTVVSKTIGLQAAAIQACFSSLYNPALREIPKNIEKTKLCRWVFLAALLSSTL